MERTREYTLMAFGMAFIGFLLLLYLTVTPAPTCAPPGPHATGATCSSPQPMVSILSPVGIEAAALGCILLAVAAAFPGAWKSALGGTVALAAGLAIGLDYLLDNAYAWPWWLPPSVGWGLGLAAFALLALGGVLAAYCGLMELADGFRDRGSQRSHRSRADAN